jgi:hypothetical protein
MTAYLKKSITLKGITWKREVEKCFKRDLYKCQICGKGTREQLVPHHIIPKGRIRIDHIDNLLTACMCHIPLHGLSLIIQGKRISVDDIIEKYRHRLKRSLY